MNDNIIQIAKILINKNINRETIWTKTSGENEYKMHLNNATLTIDMWEDEDGENYEITIYNDKGDEIEGYHSMENDFLNIDRFHTLKKLYETTVDAYFKKGEVMNDILSQLSEEGIVGNHNKK